MATFLLEFYVSPTAEAGKRGEHARQVAEELSRQGTPVRYLRSIFVPQDETCFHLYEATSIESVRQVAERASLSCVHICEAVSEEARAQPELRLERSKS
jgi:hypothetical protein